MAKIRRSRSKGLLAALSVFALLYLWFFVESCIPRPEGSWTSTVVPFDPWAREQIILKTLFPIFITGYVLAWSKERVAGLIFIFWWIGMWSVELFVMAPVVGGDGGGGIAMGLPLFVLGVLFWSAGMRRDRETATESA